MDDQLQEMTNFIDNFNERPKERVEKSDLIIVEKTSFFALTCDRAVFGFLSSKVSGKGKGSKKGKLFNVVVAEMIKRAYGWYVENLRHTKAKVIIGAYLVAGSFKWQGDLFRKLSGLCMMRVMETYSGEDLQRWDNGLDGDKVKLEKQLGILAKKYVAKIMLSESNLIMATIRGKLATFKV